MTPILNVLDTLTATSVNNRIMLLIQTVVDFIIFIMTILQTKGLTSVARRITSGSKKNHVSDFILHTTAKIGSSGIIVPCQVVVFVVFDVCEIIRGSTILKPFDISLP